MKSVMVTMRVRLPKIIFIFDGEGLLYEQNEYVKNICISRSSKSEVMAEEFKREVIISADSSSSEE
jgi:hypothetical protein